MTKLTQYWDTKCEEFFELCTSRDLNHSNNLKRKILGEICSNMPKLNRPEYIAWMVNALGDNKKKWFVSEIFKKYKRLPLDLLTPFIEAAINEPDLSKNRHFVEPCVVAFGPEVVSEQVNIYISSGTPEQKFGAKNALYWVTAFEKQ